MRKKKSIEQFFCPLGRISAYGQYFSMKLRINCSIMLNYFANLLFTILLKKTYFLLNSATWNSANFNSADALDKTYTQFSVPTIVALFNFPSP